MIYLDGAATKEPSKVSKMAIEEGMKYWGNPSSNYEFADKAKSLVRVARQRVAQSIGAREDEIIFTSGGSESDNMAIKGVVFASENKKKHIITSKIEHKAVLNTCAFLEKHGLAEISYIDVDENGVVDLKQLEYKINENTILISIMAVNNELGVVQPLRKIAEIAKKNNVLFHTDAVQAYGKFNLDVHDIGIDLMSASGHKIGTPKGIGFLYARMGVPVEPLIHGGGQELGWRAGTENVPYINALGYEAMNIDTNLHQAYTMVNTTKLVKKMKEQFGDDIRFATKPRNGCIVVGFEGVDAVALQALLSLNNIQVSIGSACNSGTKRPSHVLQAIGVQDDMIYNYIRMTMPSTELSDDEVTKIVEVLELGKQMFGLPKKG